MNKITFDNKISELDISSKYVISAPELNEIKEVVNNLIDKRMSTIFTYKDIFKFISIKIPDFETNDPYDLIVEYSKDETFSEKETILLSEHSELFYIFKDTTYLPLFKSYLNFEYKNTNLLLLNDDKIPTTYKNIRFRFKNLNENTYSNYYYLSFYNISDELLGDYKNDMNLNLLFNNETILNFDFLKNKKVSLAEFFESDNISISSFIYYKDVQYSNNEYFKNNNVSGFLNVTPSSLFKLKYDNEEKVISSNIFSLNDYIDISENKLCKIVCEYSNVKVERNILFKPVNLIDFYIDYTSDQLDDLKIKLFYSNNSSITISSFNNSNIEISFEHNYCYIDNDGKIKVNQNNIFSDKKYVNETIKFTCKDSDEVKIIKSINVLLKNNSYFLGIKAIFDRVNFYTNKSIVSGNFSVYTINDDNELVQNISNSNNLTIEYPNDVEEIQKGSPSGIFKVYHSEIEKDFQINFKYKVDYIKSDLFTSQKINYFFDRDVNLSGNIITSINGESIIENNFTSEIKNLKSDIIDSENIGNSFTKNYNPTTSRSINLNSFSDTKYDLVELHKKLKNSDSFEFEKLLNYSDSYNFSKDYSYKLVYFNLIKSNDGTEIPKKIEFSIINKNQYQNGIILNSLINGNTSYKIVDICLKNSSGEYKKIDQKNYKDNYKFLPNTDYKVIFRGLTSEKSVKYGSGELNINSEFNNAYVVALKNLYFGNDYEICDFYGEFETINNIKFIEHFIYDEIHDLWLIHGVPKKAHKLNKIKLSFAYVGE